MRTRTPLAAAVTATLATVLAAGAATPATAAPGPAHAAPAWPAHSAGAACSPRVRIRGYSDTLDKTRFHGTPVAGLSALAQDGRGGTLALSDRSVLFTLDVRRGGHGSGAPDARTTAAVPLADEAGRPLDSEGLVAERDGSRLVTSETEPSIRRYDAAGHLTGRLPVPRMLRVAPAGRAQRNATFEGLTELHGGRTLVASVEEPLAGDGEDARGRPLVRFQTWQRGRQGQRHRHGDLSPARQWAYPVDHGLGVAEIAATGEGRLLVLERGYDADTHANTIRLYLADPRGASDVRDVGTLGTRAHPHGGPAPLRKTLLADLGHCPDLGAPNPSPQPNPLLDNIEALTVTGHAPGGRLRLLLASDDNESPGQVTRLYALTASLPRG